MERIRKIFFLFMAAVSLVCAAFLASFQWHDGALVHWCVATHNPIVVAYIMPIVGVVMAIGYILMATNKPLPYESGRLPKNSRVSKS